MNFAQKQGPKLRVSLYNQQRSSVLFIEAVHVRKLLVAYLWRIKIIDVVTLLASR